MATVEFEHVEKVFANGVRALADCTLAIADGELLVLVGPSGCGKSTLLRLLAGLETPTAGTIRIDSRVANELTPQARNVAMVFQDYALYPHLSARKNLDFPLKMRKLSRAARKERIEAVARLLEITHLLDRLPRQLSGGQRQRVAMGRALVREPSVFLLDEPLSNLDAKLRVQVRAEIKDLQRRTRTTMLYVTHDQVEAMTLGDRVAVLDRGVLQQIGTPQDLYDRPVNLFVAGFIGNPPMNLFSTTITAGTPATLRVGDQMIPATGLAVPAGAPLTAGIRPEAIQLGSEDGPGLLRATVEHVEYLGHETLAHVRAGAGADSVRLIARLAGMHRLDPTAVIRLRLDPERLYLFDASGMAAPVPPSAGHLP